MIQSGSLRGANGSSIALPSGHVLDGNWGSSGTAWLVGNPMQRVPDHLHLLWFAYAEDKFYEGDFALPQDKIYALLKAGYWDTDKNEHGTYNEFIVCVLPKGGVVAWLQGGNQVVLGRFQGHEVFPSAEDYERYYGTANRADFVRTRRAEMPAAVQQEIKAGTISPKKWDEYLKTYPWHVAFNVPFPLYTSYNIHYVNEEYTNYPLTRDATPYNQVLLTPTPKPIPSACSFYGQAAHGSRYELRVEAFDEAETQAAFRTLQQLSPQSPITLLFTLDKPFQKAALTLQNEAKAIPLTKSPVEVFSMD